MRIPKTYEELLGLEEDHPSRAPIISEKLVDKTSIQTTPLVEYGGMESSTGRKERQTDTDSKLFIDFNNMPNTYWRWCDRLETKRTWYHARFDKVHRGTVESLKKDVEERDEELDIVKLMKKQQKPLFSAVMNEFKEKLEKIKNE